MSLLALARRNTTPAAAYQQIATECGVDTGASAPLPGYTARTIKRRHDIRAPATDLRVALNGVNLQGPALNPVTTRVSVETAGGTIYPVTFSGAPSVTVSPGAGVISDPVDITLADGDVLFTRLYQEVGVGQQLPTSSRFYLTTSEGEGLQWGTDLTAGGSIPLGNATGPTVLALLGTPPASRTTAFALIGDSITAATGDDWMATPGHSGFAVRAMNAAGLPYISYAVGGDRASLMNNPARQAYWWTGIEGCDRFVTAYGINDLAGSATLAQLQSNSIDLWSALRARGLTGVQGTTTPWSSSTDSWATVGNQTPALPSEANRVAWNTWLRDGAPLTVGLAAVASGGSGIRAGETGHPLLDVVDVAAAVESSLNSGRWMVGATDEGLHPNATGHVLMAAPLTAWLDTL